MKSNGNIRILYASTGTSSVGVISGISTVGTAFTVVGIPNTFIVRCCWHCFSLCWWNCVVNI